MKRIVLALVPALILAGCSTQNSENQQLSATQSLAQPAPAAQPTQTQTSASLATEPTSQTKKITIGKPLQYDAEVAPAQNSAIVTPTQNDAAGQTQTASNVQLTASEIQTQFVGVKLKWKDKSSDLTGRITYNQDSRANYRFGSSLGHGKWKMEGISFVTIFRPKSIGQEQHGNVLTYFLRMANITKVFLPTGRPRALILRLQT